MPWDLIILSCFAAGAVLFGSVGIPRLLGVGRLNFREGMGKLGAYPRL